MRRVYVDSLVCMSLFSRYALLTYYATCIYKLIMYKLHTDVHKTHTYVYSHTSARAHTHANKHTHTLYIYIYIYINGSVDLYKEVDEYKFSLGSLTGEF